MAVNTLQFEIPPPDDWGTMRPPWNPVAERSLGRVPQANSLRIELLTDQGPDWTSWYLELHPSKGAFSSALTLATSIGEAAADKVTFDLTAEQMHQPLEGQPARRLWVSVYALRTADSAVRTFLTGYLTLDADAAALTTGPPPEPFLPFATRGEVQSAVAAAAGKADYFPFALSVNRLAASATIPTGHNVVTTGPLHLPEGVDLHIPAGANFHVVNPHHQIQINNQEELGGPQVLMAFAEAVGDLADSIGFMWIAAADNPRQRLRYRKEGEVTWSDVAAPSGVFWTRSERVHRARIFGLAPDTVYELRPWGAPLSDIRRIRTAPAGVYEPRLIHLADYQTNNYTPGAPFDAMNAVVGQHLDDVHLLVGGGDYVSDDGIRDAAKAAQWWNFLTSLHTHFKRSDGTLVPWVWLAGNHEVVTNYANVADPENPVSEAGFMQQFWQLGWDTSLPNTLALGHGWLRLGDNLLLVFVDTNHVTHLTDQLDSFKAILTQHAPTVRHVCIVSHVSPWRGQNTTDAWAAHRQLRREFLPFAQEFSNLKFWLTGHEHNFAVTYSIRAVPETGNEYKWVRDEERGVVFTGHGGWATVSTRGLANVALASPVDGSFMYESYIMRRSSDLALVIHNIENSPSTPSSGANSYSEAYHFWRYRFGAEEAEAVALSATGVAYKTITRPLA